MQINERLYQNYKESKRPLSPFVKPDGVVSVALDKISYYDTHTLSLADEKTPNEYRFIELFKKGETPIKSSNLFTNPSIIPPKVAFLSGKVVITFAKNSPEFYQYKIERYDYVRHTTVYFGKVLSEFIDETVSKNKRYIYTVTPYYGNVSGISITLPTVNTSEDATELDRGEILDENWWEY